MSLTTSLLRRSILLAWLLSLAALAGEGADNFLLLGDTYLSAQENTWALQAYRTAAILDHGNAALWLRLGKWYLAKGRYLQAEPFLRRAACLDESASCRPAIRTAALLLLGNLYIRTNRPALAAAAFRMALGSGAAARYPLALTYLLLGDVSAAKEHLILLAEAGHQGALLHLGLLLAITQPQDALPLLRRAQAGPDPNLADASREAITSLQSIGDACPPFPDAVYGSGEEAACLAAMMGYTALRLNLPAVARAAYGMAIEHSPGYAHAWAYLGYSLYLLGDYEGALKAAARAIAWDDTAALAYHVRGLVYRAQGRPEQALAEMEAALRHDPTNSAILGDLGETYAAQGNYLKAQADLLAAALADPQSLVPWLRLARFHLGSLFQVEEGLLAAQQAVALAPSNGEALDWLGWGQYLNGRSQEALATLHQATIIAPQSARAYYHLAVVAHHTGDLALASRAYKRAIDLDVGGFYEERALKGLKQLEGR